MNYVDHTESDHIYGSWVMVNLRWVSSGDGLKVFEQAGVSPNHMIEANETGCFVSHHLDFAGDLWGGVILSVCNIHRFWKLYCMVILSEHTSAVHGEHGSSGRLLHTIDSSLSLSHGGK